MASDTIDTGRRGLPWRPIGWGFAGFLLLLPLLAMQFTKEVNWTFVDFVFAAIVFGGIGGALELLARMSRNTWYRAGGGVALLATFLVIWINAAVGMIGSEDSPFVLLFGGVLTIALIGAIIARFEAAGMMHAMVGAGLAQAALGAFGLATDVRGGTFTLILAAMWWVSAALFSNAAQRGDA